MDETNGTPVPIPASVLSPDAFELSKALARIVGTTSVVRKLRTQYSREDLLEVVEFVDRIAREALPYPLLREFLA